MTELKCPFCKQKLHKDSDSYYTCYTDNCGCMKYGGNGASGSESLWLALIRTRKALDVANEKLKHCVNMTVEELDELKGNLLIAWNALSHFSKDPIANDALKKITALEQKDK